MVVLLFGACGLEKILGPLPFLAAVKIVNVRGEEAATLA